MHPEQGNKVPWIVFAVLALVLVIGGIARGTPEPPPPIPPPPPNGRALSLPNDGKSRMVVVPPCGASAKEIKTAEKDPGQAFTIRFRLGGTQDTPRALIVPDCDRPQGAKGPATPVYSFVLPYGTVKLEDPYPATQIGARSQISLPTGSGVNTIVVPACVKDSNKPAAKAQDVILSPAKGKKSAIAPNC